MKRNCHFCITQVKKDSNGTIQSVKVAINLIDEVSKDLIELNVDQVIRLIKDGAIFMTFHKRNKKLTPGALVDFYEQSLSDTRYLRTNPNDKCVDNLDNLPTY